MGGRVLHVGSKKRCLFDAKQPDIVIKSPSDVQLEPLTSLLVIPQFWYIK